MAANMHWPQVIFIESTSLYQLGARLETVDLAKLIEIRDSLGIRLCVSEVSWLEYVRHRKREIQAALRQIVQSQSGLAAYDQQLGGLEDAREKAKHLLDGIEAFLAERAGKLRLEIVPTPNIDMNRLLRMSIDCVAPFEESNEKGFRDSVIMFTVLSTVRGRSEDNCMVITADKLMRNGFERFASEFDTTVDVVPDFAGAMTHMSARLNEVYRERLRAESDEAKAVLNAHRAEILAKVQEIRELSPMDFLGLFGVVGGFEEGGKKFNVEQILGLRFEEVESALWKGKEQSPSRILFQIRCEATVRASEQDYSWFLDTPRFQVGGQTTYQVRAARGEPVEKKLPIRFYGEAELVRKDETWDLSGLRIEKRPPDTDTLVELMMIV